MKPIKMAIVGAGLWGEAHASIYQEHPLTELVAICDLDEQKALRFAKRFNVSNVYRSVDCMLKECECDAVAIVTPDFLHADIAIACAQAKKHMIIEKPLATSRDDIYRMIEAVEKNGVRAMVDFHNRWNPAFNSVKQLVESGKYGTPTNAHFRLNDNLWVATDMLSWCAKSSILWFLGSHSLDTTNWILNDYPTEVYAVKSEGRLKQLGINAVDTYMSTVRYSRGGVLQMENSWVTPNGNPNVNDFKFYLLCSDGKFDINASSHDLLQVTDQRNLITQDVLVKNIVFGQCRGFAYESIRSFVDKLYTGDPFHVSLNESANVSLSLLAIMESSEKGIPIIVERI